MFIHVELLRGVQWMVRIDNFLLFLFFVAVKREIGSERGREKETHN